MAPPHKKLEIPASFQISITIVDYHITASRLIGAPLKVGSIRFDRMYSDRQNAWAQFTVTRSDADGQYIYMAKLPFVRNGSYPIDLVRQNFPANMEDLTPSPEKIEIECYIRDGQLSHAIRTPAAANIGLRAEWFRSERADILVARLRSSVYIDDLWEVNVPTEDGNYLLVAIRR